MNYTPKDVPAFALIEPWHLDSLVEHLLLLLRKWVRLALSIIYWAVNVLALC